MNNIFLTLMQRGVGWNAIRALFAHIDMGVFFIFRLATQAIFDLANLTLFDEKFFNDFADRVYILVGIFMLFRVTIAMLGYLVDPDKISDKSEGLSKIISRTIISICMLAGLPFVWNLLFGKVVNNRSLNDIMIETIPKIIIGKGSSKETVTDDAEGIANRITWEVYSVFFHMNDENSTPISLSDCDGEDAGFCSISWSADHVNDAGGSNDVYNYDYIPFVGTIIGIVMCIAMVSIAIDVAIRIFKLVILRMIAPIPILGYILPKSKKGDLFGNWVKTLIMTWADLFIKLGIIYFVLFMIDEIIFQNTIDLSSLDGLRKGAVIVFIIVGLLFFAKSAPKFVTDLLGIKEAPGIMATLGRGAATVAAVSTLPHTYQANRAAGRTVFGSALRSGGGMIGSLYSSSSSLNGKDASFMAGVNAVRKYENANLSRMSSTQKAISSAAQDYYDFAVAEGTKKFSDEDLAALGGNHSLNQLNAAIQYANANGTTVKFFQYDAAGNVMHDAAGNIMFEATDYGAVEGSTVQKMLGDSKDEVGNMFRSASFDRHDPNYSSIDPVKRSTMNLKADTLSKAEGKSGRSVRGESLTAVKGTAKGSKTNAGYIDINKMKE